MAIRLRKKIIACFERGLNSFELKIIALICMTFGTLAMFGDNIVPIITSGAMQLNQLSMAAIPLFLFVLVYSARYTSSKKRFLLRLYLAGLISGLVICILNLFFAKETNWYYLIGNHSMFFTLFYTVVYIYLIETLIEKKNNKIWYLLGILAITFVPDRLWHFIGKMDFFYALVDTNNNLWIDLLNIIFANPIHTEYGLQLIILGVVMYFVKNKKWQCLVLLAFVGVLNLLYCIDLYGSGLQFLYTIPNMIRYLNPEANYMLLALPFMLLYNGKSDNRWKWFFYAYYPIHSYLIFLLCM